MYRVLGLIDGINIKGTHDFGCDAWLTIDDAHHLLATRASGVGLQTRKMRERTAIEVLSTIDILARRTIPDAQEDALQLVDGIALDATVHVAPFAHLFRTFI